MILFDSEGFWDNYKFLDTIAELRNLSLIQSFNTETGTTTFSLHPLIQDWTKLRLDTQSRQTYTIESMLILSEYMNTQDSDRMTLHQNRHFFLIWILPSRTTIRI